jgi:type I restriction enzyme S subunit
VRVNHGKLLPEYFAYLIQSEYGKAYFLKVAHRTTNLASINSTKLKALPVIFPDIETQSLISEQIGKMDLKIEQESKHKSALESLFNSLLHHLMTGKLRAQPTPSPSQLGGGLKSLP